MQSGLHMHRSSYVCKNQQVFVELSISALDMTLPAAACSSGACKYRSISSIVRARAAAKLLLRSGAGGMDRKAAAIDGTDKRTDGHPTVT